MIAKKRVDGGARVKVTFTLPAGDGPAFVAGDFNGWDTSATPMRKRGDACSASVTLDHGQRYAFRYVDARGAWFNDDQPDDFEANGLGEANGIIDLTEPV